MYNPINRSVRESERKEVEEKEAYTVLEEVGEEEAGCGNNLAEALDELGAPQEMRWQLRLPLTINALCTHDLNDR